MSTDNKKNSIKKFWEERGDKYSKIPYESLSNFETDPKILLEKIENETRLVLKKLPFKKFYNLLDLGSGVGQWTFRLSPFVKKITAVEYASSQIKIAKKEQDKREITNIEFIESPAEIFLSPIKFDIIFISGLFVYLNNQQAKSMICNIKKMITSTSTVFLREPSSILKDRYELTNIFSNELKTHYSATYRTRNEIIKLFSESGFICTEDANFFEEGSHLNKFPETRLRYYILRAK